MSEAPASATDVVRPMAALANASWAALERQRAHGWELRFAAGVTKRANSAWPVDGVADASAEALAAVERVYRSRGVRPIFQLSSADGEALLRLLERGYRVVDETLVLAASVPRALASDPEVTIAEEPDAAWLSAWWAVDGRGGDAELDVARRIMLGTPALYAALRMDGAVVSVARLALVDTWGGLYCVATLPDYRRRGFGARVVRALLAAGAARGVTDAWLQVLAANEGARALYTGRFGFRETERYRYLVGPLGDERGASG